MSLTTPGPDGDDTARFRAAVAFANIPTLLMVLVQLTGDLGWLDEPYRLSRTKGMSDNDTGAPTANDVIVNIFYR